MKKSIFMYAFVGFLAGTLIKGCGKTPEQKVENAKENVGDAKKELNEAQAKYLAEWEKFKHESELAIDASEKKIDTFKKKMDGADSKIKTKYSKDVATLELKNRDMRMKLAEFKYEEQSRWEDFKKNFSREMDEMGMSIEALFKENS